MEIFDFRFAQLMSNQFWKSLFKQHAYFQTERLLGTL